LCAALVAELGSAWIGGAALSAKVAACHWLLNGSGRRCSGRALSRPGDFVSETFRHFPRSFAEFVNRLAQSVPNFRQARRPKDNQRHHDDDDDMERLDSEWHEYLLLADAPQAQGKQVF